MPETEEYQKLIDWMREQGIGSDRWLKKYIYREAAMDQMLFFRDQITPLFIPKDVMESEDRPPVWDFACIAGWHQSKSITLPVYYYKTNRVEVIARDNFYNWNVSIKSHTPIHLDDYFEVNKLDGYLFMEGMEPWKYPIYDKPCFHFSFAKTSKYELYAIMKCIASQVR